MQPPTDKGRRLRIFYMTQASTCPPTFVCFCNDARLFHFSYQRYLENQIREVFGLTGTGYFDMVAYEKYNDGKMSDYIPTDEELAESFKKLP